ncbi:hypothetical protein OWV82_017988 [Melia azedarach]|uniref:Uncharacterized protein n=1 Tax=Melia azedarach TaxID=155640 RepID=A0ACC1XA90_MELAZ|nr:hypothetical protein OWV82_017988 [Melia azedarach]
MGRRRFSPESTNEPVGFSPIFEASNAIFNGQLACDIYALVHLYIHIKIAEVDEKEIQGQAKLMTRGNLEICLLRTWELHHAPTHRSFD